MKTLFLLACLSANVLACEKGFEPDAATGVCMEVAQPVQPSDEKPPTDKMPSYERPGIVVERAIPGVEPSTTTAHDYAAEANAGRVPVR